MPIKYQETMNELRFAPLIRVSTEQQERQGESLNTQRTYIIKYVESLHGVIPENCWSYCGQEHATEGYERQRLDKLLDDSGKGIFDAVIVTDASRWSRENLRCEIGLNLLADNGIRFFVGTMEYDLYNADHRFMLTMSTAMNQLQASKSSINSIINRIEKAKRGCNAAGRLPYGRTFDKKAEKWGIDPVKKALIEEAAKRYLKGEHLKDIATTLHMDQTTLWDILTNKSGPTRTQRFRYKNIDETVTTTIPALLDEKTIKEVKERSYINTTNRGNVKNKYLLSGFIYCAKCGLKLMAYTNINDVQYYKHKRTRPGIGRCFKKFVSLPEIETAVLLSLIKTFGDPDLIEKAIRDASPDMEKRVALEKEQAEIESELKIIVTEKKNLIRNVAKGKLSDDDIDPEMSEIRGKEGSFKGRLSIIEAELSSTPDPEHVKRLSKWAGKIIADITKDNPKLIFKRSFEWKRKLIERAFNGVDASGKHLGVYITYAEGKFTFEIKGLFESTINALPITDDDLIQAFHLDPEFDDITQEVSKIRETLILNIESRHNIKPFGEIFITSCF